MDTHPIHTHLTQFQVVGRIPFDFAAYEADWMTLNRHGTRPARYSTANTLSTTLPSRTNGAPSRKRARMERHHPNAARIRNNHPHQMGTAGYTR